MKITYIGHSSFIIKGKENTLVIDPYNPNSTGYKYPKQKADLLLTTHFHDDHYYIDGVGDYSLHISGPGEYEKNSSLIYGMPTFHDDQNGDLRGKNTIYEIHIDDFTLLHLGDLGHQLKETTTERISDIDVLFIPVGGVYTIDSSVASRVISSIEPKIVIPMHYQTEDLKLPEKLDKLEKFLNEMGVDETKQLDELVLKSKSDIPDETEVTLLNPTH
jgi:L-ascorbate metabolism protein UlaG (beta-lactamase superfamily)